MKITWTRLGLACALLLLLPAVTSCGELSFGFPAPIYHQQDQLFRPWALLLDLVTVAALVLLLRRLLSKSLTGLARTAFVTTVICLLELYLMAIAFVALEHVSSRVAEGSLIALLFAVQWPMLILTRIESLLSVPSWLYKDSFDLLIRVGIIIGIAIWAGLAVLTHYLILRWKNHATNHRKKTSQRRS